MQDTIDRFAVLIKQESSLSCRDYLSSPDLKGVDSVVDEKCRCTMAKWSYTIIEYFHFNRETANMAISYTDRFLSSDQGAHILRDRRLFQLASLCSLTLSIKLLESTVIEADLLVRIGLNYSIDEIVQMEHRILAALQWRMCLPIASVFLDCLLDLFSTSALDESSRENLRATSQKQIDSASHDYFFATVRPSLIALASLLNAVDSLSLPNSTYRCFMNNLSLLTETNDIKYDNFVHLRTALSQYCDGIKHLVSTSEITDMFCAKMKLCPRERLVSDEEFSPKSIVKH